MTIPFDNSCDSLLLQWFLSPTTQRSHKFILYISHDKKDFWMLVAITYLPTHKLSFMRSHLYGLPNDCPHICTACPSGMPTHKVCLLLLKCHTLLYLLCSQAKFYSIDSYEPMRLTPRTKAEWPTTRKQINAFRAWVRWVNWHRIDNASYLVFWCRFLNKLELCNNNKTI